MQVSCGCGQSTLEIRREPELRAICHCTLCQRFNQAPYADILVLKATDAQLLQRDTVDFQQLKSPPAVDRGKCKTCGQPVVEYLKLPLLPEIAMVPAAMLEGKMTLPAPAIQMFYDSRIADNEAGPPHYSGFVASQWAATRRILPVLFSH